MQPKGGGNVYFIAITAAEVSPLLVIEFLHRVIDIFVDYFGMAFSESALKEEFIKVYQVASVTLPITNLMSKILEEMMDDGFPFITEPNILREMVKPPNLVDKV